MSAAYYKNVAGRFATISNRITGYLTKAGRMKITLCLLLGVALSASFSEAIVCYSCRGDSGISSSAVGTTTNYCGLPFRDDGTYLGVVQTVSCDGVCITQASYRGGTTNLIRACSDVPITDGCERTVDSTTSDISWTCIKSCTTDKCNTRSGAANIVPPQLVLLLLVAAAILPFTRSSH
jgi:hypothetical protein